MKNNKKHFLSRIKNLLHDILFSFIPFFIFRKPHIVFIDSQKKSFSSNSKHLFLYFLKEHPDVVCKYIVECDSERSSLTEEFGNHFIKGRSLKDKMFILKSYVWITSSMYTPLLGFFYNRRRLVLHLSHGTLFKKAGLAEQKIKPLKKIFYYIAKTNFSYFYITSTKLIEHACSLYGVRKDKILVNSMPSCDALFKTDFSKTGSTIRILYSPTWRGENDVDFFPFNDFDLVRLNAFLDSYKMEIFLRPHPDFENDLSHLKGRNIKAYGSSIEKDIYNSLAKFDVLISDYSSVFLDFMLLKKTIILIPYDLQEYEKKVGFFFDYRNDAPGISVASQAELEELLKKVATHKDKVVLNDNFSRMNESINQYKDGKGALRCADFVKSKLDTYFN